MITSARRLLGLTMDGRPIYEPHPNASAIIFAAMGGGKTTCVSMTAILSLLADKQQALFINDVKNGEIAAQIAQMCLKHGRKFGVVDDCQVMGADYPHRIHLNPFGALQAALLSDVSHLPFVVESTVHTLIDEPADDKKNFYWREAPREFLELGIKILIHHNPRLLTPGGLHALLSDPHTWNNALENEAADPDSPNRDAAAQILEMRASNPEHYSQHLRAALSALKIFSFPALKDVGRENTITHEQLLGESWVICFVNPVRYADRLGPYFALHNLSLLHAQMSGINARACLILDEFCNAPLREAVNRITVFRAFGLKALYITQSRQDVVRKYGERETAILEENCAIKQWLKFSNFEEAERVSRAMGEAITLSHSLGLNSDRTAFSGNLGTGKERLFTAEELMRLPDDEQIIHVAGIGFIHAKKTRQNEIAPYCFELADNPLEGGRLTPNPKVHLPVHLEDAP